jgi:flagellar biosynthesis protein FliR
MIFDLGGDNVANALVRSLSCAVVMARVLGLCLTAPALAIPELDWRFRLGVTAAVGAALVPVIEPRVAAPLNFSSAALLLTVEVLVGAALGWSAALVIAGARQGGELVAAHAGLTTATLLDPETGEEHTSLGRLFGWIALAVFLALNGPLALVRVLAESYEAIPAGRLAGVAEVSALAFAPIGRALELVLKVAAPPALALVIASIVLGLLSRAAPSLPFVALTPPIRIALGIVVVVFGLATLAMTLSNDWRNLYFVP